MNKGFRKSLVGLVLAGLFLTGCGNQMNTTSPLINMNGNVQANSLISDIINSPAENQDLERINRSIDFSTGTRNTLNNGNLKFYMGGKEAYPALEQLIMNAKESLYVEVFVFHNDYTGKKIAEGLVNKAREGVEVKLIYDYFGNVDVKLMNYMAKNGVHIETYNKGVLTSKGANITHRKVYIADGVRGMIGGMNIGEKYAHEWHDTMMNLEGEAIKEILNEFFFDWKRAGGEITPLMKKAVENPIDLSNSLIKTPLRVTVTSPHEADKKQDIKRMMIGAIDAAKNNIKVAMPYFSDDEFIEHLIYAQKRGVNVTALIPFKSDQKLFDLVSTNTANQLIEAGVTVYRTGAKDNTFSHSKVLTVDSVWTTLGSCNADYRAFHRNQELNVGVSDAMFTHEVNTRFFDELIRNSEVGTFKKIPWFKKPLYSFLEGVDILF